MARAFGGLWLSAGLWLGATAAVAQPAPVPPAPATPPAAPASAPVAPAAQGASAPAAPPASSAPAPPASSAPVPESGTAGSYEGARRVAEFVTGLPDAAGRPCDVRQIAREGELHYVACGTAGVWVVREATDGQLLLVARHAVAGSAEGFFSQAGALWVRAQRVEAYPVHDLQGRGAPPAATASPRAARPSVALTPAPVATPPEQLEAPPMRGQVLSVNRGKAIVDIGRDAGLRPGDRVALLVERSRLAPGGLIVGEVEQVGADSAEVTVGVNVDVPPGTEAVRTVASLTSSRTAPPRAGGVWEVEFLARPFLVLGNLGFGAQLDARAGFRGSDNYHIEALLQPLSFATGDEGSLSPAAALVTAAYDGHLFAVGLGIGGQSVKDTDFGFEPGSGLTVAQRARLGARDGLHLEVISSVVLFHSEFELSDVRVVGQMPVGASSWLRVAGGGGLLGLAFGEVGLRVLLSGNGMHDSVFLTTVIGLVHVFEDLPCTPNRCGDEIDYAGPSVGGGLEWRM